MKKPYLNQEQRESIRLETMLGAHLELNLAVQRLRRDTYKSKGCIAMKRAEKYIIALVNNKMFNNGL